MVKYTVKHYVFKVTMASNNYGSNTTNCNFVIKLSGDFHQVTFHIILEATPSKKDQSTFAIDCNALASWFDSLLMKLRTCYEMKSWKLCLVSMCIL